MSSTGFSGIPGQRWWSSTWTDWRHTWWLLGTRSLEEEAVNREQQFLAVWRPAKLPELFRTRGQNILGVSSAARNCVDSSRNVISAISDQGMVRIEQSSSHGEAVCCIQQRASVDDGAKADRNCLRRCIVVKWICEVLCSRMVPELWTRSTDCMSTELSSDSWNSADVFCVHYCCNCYICSVNKHCYC